MDMAALRNRIQSTLDANADVRRQAELDLRYVRPFKASLALVVGHDTDTAFRILGRG